jgi:hypothetical protein
VGVWRELRRIPSIPAGAPEHLRAAHNAVNKVAMLEGRQDASVAWDHYCKAQGGVFCGRDALIKLTMVEGEKLGRYGDDPARRPVGVETIERRVCEVESNPGTCAELVIVWAVESVRHSWEIVRGARGADEERPSGRLGGKQAPWVNAEAMEIEIANAYVDETRLPSIAKRAQPAKPWTRVNNCTPNTPENSTSTGDHRHRSPQGHNLTYGEVLMGDYIGELNVSTDPPVM